MRSVVKAVIFVSLFCLWGGANAQGNLTPQQLERLITSRALWEKKQKIVDTIIAKDTAALESELKKGFSANSYISGNSMLAYAIDYRRWDMVFLLLKYGADIHAPVQSESGTFSNLLFLEITLENVAPRMRDFYFYQCLSLVKYYGKDVQVSSKRGFVPIHDSSKNLSARYTWELVSQKNVPVVWAAAFTNNIELLQILNLKGTDKPYAPTEDLLSLLKEKSQKTFPVVFAKQETTPSYWVKQWAAYPEQKYYTETDYKNVLQSF